MGKKQTPSVMFIAPCKAVGGVSRVLYSLTREFTTRHWPVRTVFPEAESQDASLAWYRAQGVAMETSPAVLDATADHTRGDMMSLRRFIRQSGADVVNLHYGDTYVALKDVLAVRLAGRRCVMTIHFPQPWDRMEAQRRVTMRRAALFTHAVIAISQPIRQLLLEAGVPARKVHVIHSGLQAPARMPSPQEARARLGLPPDAFVITASARLVPHKGIADLIVALSRIPDPAGKLRLVVAGDGSERAALEAQAADCLKDRAIFLGWVSDPSDAYAAADVFALTPHEEGFGLVYLEAAFFGIPSIGTTVGGVPEAVLDGQTGLLVPPADPAALAAALQRLRDMPKLRGEMGQAAQVRARTEFTEAAMADRYTNVLMP